MWEEKRREIEIAYKEAKDAADKLKDEMEKELEEYKSAYNAEMVEQVQS